MDYQILKDDLSVDMRRMVKVYRAHVRLCNGTPNGTEAIWTDFKFEFEISESTMREYLPSGGYTGIDAPMIVARNLFLHKLRRAYELAESKGPTGSFDPEEPLVIRPPSSE